MWPGLFVNALPVDWEQLWGREITHKVIVTEPVAGARVPDALTTLKGGVVGMERGRPAA